MAKTRTPPKLSTPQKLQKLQLFNEKVETLRRGRFISQVSNGEHAVTLHFDFEKQARTVHKRGPDEEAILALATTLRFFVQEKDGIKLEQIAKIYESLPVEDMAKQSSRAAVDALVSYLDSPSGFASNGETITNRKIFEIFMYGSLAHANDDKRAVYEAWMKDPVLAHTLRFFFEDIVARMVGVIQSFYAMNERTIRLLENGSRT